jgi:hypothetical protein
MRLVRVLGAVVTGSVIGLLSPDGDTIRQLLLGRGPQGTPRTALLAGATGLVGHALLPLLRRAAPDIKASPKLKVHHVDFAMLPAAFPTVDDVFITLGTTIKVAGSEAAFRQVRWPSYRRWAPMRNPASSTIA